MSILDSTDIGVSCDDCGATANVDVTNDVLHKLARREWNTHGGEHCPECAERNESALEAKES